MEDQGVEAARVTSWIQALVSLGIPESEIAILFDKQPDLNGGTLRQALDGAGVTYRNEQQLQDLAAQPLTRLLVAYFETLAGGRRTCLPAAQPQHALQRPWRG